MKKYTQNRKQTGQGFSGYKQNTVAIVIKEYLDKTKLSMDLQVFATDIDKFAIDKARAGTYRDRLKEIDPAVRAIVSSGYSNDPVIANYSEYGFCGMVTKPYQVVELARILHEVIAR